MTRCTNNFGPYQFPEKAIPLFTTNLLDGGTIPLYGDGLNERDWIFVDDHCAGVQLVLDTGMPGEIYNIGAGNETPNRVLVDKLLDGASAWARSRWSTSTDRLGHDRRYSVDITKVTELGWQRVRTLDEALEATVAWYRDNRWWWEPLKRHPARRPRPTMIDQIGVVVVNHNGGDLTLACLRTCSRPTGPPGQTRVVLVDNGSDDGIASRVRRELPHGAGAANRPATRGFGAGLQRRDQRRSPRWTRSRSSTTTPPSSPTGWLRSVEALGEDAITRRGVPQDPPGRPAPVHT